VTQPAHSPVMSTKASGKSFTFEEVEKHNKKDDCWMIIHGKVYDVTNFLVEHPGGEEVMLESKGTNGVGRNH
jgi:cytochrome b involved in lipid metabolism